MYTVVNSNAYDHDVAIRMHGWVKRMIGIDAVIGVLLVLWKIVLIKNFRRRNDIVVKAE